MNLNDVKTYCVSCDKPTYSYDGHCTVCGLTKVKVVKNK